MESREPYEKPELVVIDLKAEEVLAVGCKTVGRSGVGNFPVCGRLQGCNQQGS
ncbi:MAG TPA: hypothetical protein VL691_09085 [Vicinamibacteria bacterium]|nr:hypothetical protein [Vicinamibacteria bacterium]